MRSAMFVTMVVVTSLAAHVAGAATDPSIARHLDEYLAARVRLGQFSGSVLVASGGQVLLRKGYGFADVERRVPNSPTTRYAIASLTKAFTAYAVLLLERDGKLSIDQPVANYLSACPPAWKDVTIDQLIHHTSGIWDYEGALELGSAAYTERMKQRGTAQSFVEQAKTQPLDFAPGTKFHYSNTGYLILGQIIERVSAVSYEEFLRTRVFEPLGLKATRHIDRDHPQSSEAIGYTHAAPLDSSILGFPLTARWLTKAPVPRLDAPHGDGGLTSAIDDLYLWSHALDAPGPIAEVLRTRLADAPEEGYGFGWIAGTRFDRKRIYHTGVLPGFVSEIDRYPESRTVIVVLSNLDRTRTSAIVRDLTSIVFGQPYDVPRSHRVSRIDSVSARPFLGHYALDDGRRLEVRHDPAGMLEVESPGQFIAGLLPESRDIFYAPMWEGTLTFAGDSSGTRTRVVLRQQGTNLRGHRVAGAGP